MFDGSMFDGFMFDPIPYHGFWVGLGITGLTCPVVLFACACLEKAFMAHRHK